MIDFDLEDFLRSCCIGACNMGTSNPEVTATIIAPVFWAWAQEQAAPNEPLHLTRRRAILLQSQADADLAKAVHRQAFLAITGVRG